MLALALCWHGGASIVVAVLNLIFLLAFILLGVDVWDLHFVVMLLGFDRLGFDRLSLDNIRPLLPNFLRSHG